MTRDRIGLPTASVDSKAGRLFIEVRINGRGPFRMVVDTGASFLTVTPRVVEEAGLKPMPRLGFKVVGGAGNTVPMQAALVDRLEAGDFRIDRLAAALMSKTDADNFSRGGNFDGWCGRAVFSDVILEMDFPGRQVSVVRAGAAHYPAETRVALENG